MKLEIQKANLAVLTKAVPDFNFTEAPTDPLELAQNLLDTMYAHKGLGLAANQCGLPYRCFVMIGSPEDYVFFNPKIVHVSPEEQALDEGCLSFPNLVLPIVRPREVRVRFTVPSGEVVTKAFIGMSARIIQHEMDHLDGILFYNRANKYHRDLAFRKAKKFAKKALSVGRKTM